MYEDIDAEYAAKELAEEHFSDRGSDGLVAGLPTTLVVSGLESQLARASDGYSDTDYLSPILDAANLIRSRSEDKETNSQVREAVRRILGLVVVAIEREWSWDLAQFGLDADGSDYEGDVLELYRFFVVDRVANAREYVYAGILADRRRIVERYKKGVEKRNQTVSEARRTFQNFDDVVVWASFPQIVIDLAGGDLAAPGTLAELLAGLELESRLLAAIAKVNDGDHFAPKYIQPILCDALAQETVIELRSRWLSDSPRKQPGDQLQEN